MMIGCAPFLNKKFYNIKLNHMKKAAANKIRLGVFVSIGITLFIAAIYLIGQRQQLFSKTFRVSGVFTDIGGLQVGNNVRFSGINVGIIAAINQHTDSTVLVDMVILEDSRKFIKKNAIAMIGSDGLMGSKLVLLTPGTAGQKVIADNDIIGTHQGVSTDEILQSLKITSDNAARITSDLAIVMQTIREGKGTLGKLLMDSTLGENVDQALVNIRKGAGGFKQNMDAAGHSFLLRGALKKKEKEKEKEKKIEKENKE
jgi:phospholipid/cholesterol/gamma-HCH transport system substrate-binding protein